MNKAALHNGQLVGIRRFIDSLTIDSEGLVDQPDSAAWSFLDETLLQGPPWSVHFAPFDAGGICFQSAYQAAFEEKENKEGLNLDAWRNRSYELACAVIAAVPFKYDYYLSLPCISPVGSFSVPLTDTVSIVMTDKESIDEDAVTSRIVRALIEAKGAAVASIELKPNTVYLRFRVEGYADNSLSSTATAAALSSIKQFLALALIFGALRKVTGIIESARLAEIQRAPRTDTPHWLLIRNDKALTKRHLSVPPDLADFANHLMVNFETIKAFLPSTTGKTLLTSIEERCAENSEELAEAISHNFRTITLFFNLRDSRDKERISSALEWYAEALVTTNQTLSLIYLCIGLEAILGDDEKSREQQITPKLADRVAYLLGSVSSERDAWRKRFRKIYDARSTLVHARTANLGRHDAILVDDARTMLRLVIAKELNSLQKHSKKSPNDP